MAKVKKVYAVDFFIDTMVSGKDIRMNGCYVAYHYSVSDCLHGLLTEIFDKAVVLFDNEMEFCVGIDSIQTRPDAYINKSYIDKVIIDDKDLWNWFYC